MATMREAALDPSLVVPERFARCEHGKFQMIDSQQAQRCVNRRGRQRHVVVTAAVGAVSVLPQGCNRVGEAVQFERRISALLLPVVAFVEQPILGLIVLGTRSDHGYINDVQDPRVAAVFVLAFILTDITVLSLAHRA